MPDPERRGAIGVIRKLLPYTSIVLGIAILYTCWTFVSRWLENRRIEEAAKTKQAEIYRRDAELYGSAVKIVSFYASPAPLPRGSRAQLCYGVTNAKTVRLDPPVERVWPSLSHCIEVAPKTETKYTLTAQDAQGHTATASFVLKLQ